MRTIICKVRCIIGLTGIKYGGNWYRLDGYYYLYLPKDGERRFIRVPKIFSNAVSIYGVCGFIIPYSKIEDMKTRWIAKGFFFRQEWKRRYYQGYEWDRFWFYFRLPKGLTEEQLIKIAVSNAMKQIKRKTDDNG